MQTRIVDNMWDETHMDQFTEEVIDIGADGR